MSNQSQPFSLKSVAIPVFLPTLLFSTGEGAIIPIIPIAADNLGATLAIAGFIAGLLMIGQLIGDIPSGALVSRFGERNSMIMAAGVSVIGLIIALVAPNEWILGIGVLLIGLATAVFALARHAFMTSFVPIEVRARTLSLLGGTFRAGFFIGPFISAGVIELTGTSSSAFIIHIVGCLGAAVILLVAKDPSKAVAALRAPSLSRSPSTVDNDEDPAATRSTPQDDVVSEAAPRIGLFRTIVNSRHVLMRMGLGAAIVGALRSSRQVILPLWAVSIGIGDSQTALIIGIAGAVDFALFYASGQLMDRFGRLASAIPTLVGLGVGHLALAFTHDLDTRVGWFIGIAMLLSVANGLGSGIMMTLGADLAPKANPAPFLGAFRFTGDAGNAASPLILAGLTAVASIAVASGVMGVIGLIGAGVMLRYIPRYVPRVPRANPGT